MSDESDPRLVGFASLAVGAGLVWLISLQNAMTKARQLSWDIRDRHFTKASQEIIGPPDRRKLNLLLLVFIPVIVVGWILTVGLLVARS